MSKIVYEHFRFTDFSSPKEHYAYATVAAKIDEEQKTVQYAVAFCSPQDHFCRRTGRELAAERLTWSGPVRTLTNFDLSKRGLSYYNLCREMLMLEMHVAGNRPAWTKKFMLL